MNLPPLPPLHLHSLPEYAAPAQSTWWSCVYRCSLGPFAHLFLKCLFTGTMLEEEARFCVPINENCLEVSSSSLGGSLQAVRIHTHAGWGGGIGGRGFHMVDTTEPPLPNPTGMVSFSILLYYHLLFCILIVLIMIHFSASSFKV